MQNEYECHTQAGRSCATCGKPLRVFKRGDWSTRKHHKSCHRQNTWSLSWDLWDEPLREREAKIAELRAKLNAKSTAPKLSTVYR